VMIWKEAWKEEKKEAGREGDVGDEGSARKCMYEY